MEFYTIGQIVNTHGLKGEVKVFPRTDFPEIRFAVGSKVWIETKEGSRIEADIDTSRLHKNVYLLLFKQFRHINDVEKFKGCYLKVSEEQQVELEQGQYYFHQIIGCDVFSDSGERLGVITEILTPGANDVWVVERPNGKPIYVPVIDDVVIQVDVDHKKVTIQLMEGML